MTVGGRDFPLRQPPARVDEPPTERQPEFVRPAAAQRAHPPLRLRPSGEPYAGEIRIAETVRLGSRIALVGDPDLQAVGEAFHRFFACDDPELPAEARLQVAGDLLRRWGAPEIAPSDLVAAAGRLHKFLDERFAGAARLKEWPVHAGEELQYISGRIDLLLDDGGDFAIIDHKSFPGAMELDDGRLHAFAGQVDLYARALRRGAGRGCREYWVHQPIAGVAVRVELRGNAAP